MVLGTLDAVLLTFGFRIQMGANEELEFRRNHGLTKAEPTKIGSHCHCCTARPLGEVATKHQHLSAHTYSLAPKSALKRSTLAEALFYPVDNRHRLRGQGGV